MSNNAMWWVKYEEVAYPGMVRVLSLSSPDLRDPKKAHKRARDTAAARLKRKGLNVRIVSSQCVG